jgi:hypothetical protein
MNLGEAVFHYFEFKKYKDNFRERFKKLAKYFSRIIRLLYLK